MQQLRTLIDHRQECNRAVVVSVARFDPGVKLQRRPGAERDSKSLHRTLSKMGFKVDIHNDLSSEEIYELFQKGTTASLRTYGPSECREHTPLLCSLTLKSADSKVY